MKGVQPAKVIVQVIVWVVASKLVLVLAMRNAVVLVQAAVEKIAQTIVVVGAKMVVLVLAIAIVQFIAHSPARNIVKAIAKLDVQPHVMPDKDIILFF